MKQGQKWSQQLTDTTTNPTTKTVPRLINTRLQKVL